MESTKKNLVCFESIQHQLHKRLVEMQGEKAHLISPLTVTCAMLMTYFGTDGVTRNEFRTLFGFSDSDEVPDEKLVVEMSTVLSKLNTVTDRFKLLLSNNMYLRSDFVLNDSFKKMISGLGDIQNVVFIDPSTVDTINKLVSKNTNNLITEMIKPTDVNKETCALILSTFYTLADFKFKFKEQLTKPDNFTCSTKEVKTMDMMEMTEYLPFYMDKHFKMVELPMDGNLYFGIICPEKSNQGSGYYGFFSDNENNCIKINPFEYLERMKGERVNLFLPKFSQRCRLNLNETFQKLGLSTLFKDGDFSKMTAIKERLEISDILQESVINVRERGIQAASSTAVIMAMRCCNFGSGEPIKFKVDHTFMYYVRQNNKFLLSGIFDG